MACPYCVIKGGDTTGNHLLVRPDSRVMCIIAHRMADDLDKDEHMSEVRRLLKIPGFVATYSGPDLRAEKAAADAIAAGAIWAGIKNELSGTLDDFGPSGPLPEGQEAFDIVCSQHATGEFMWIGTRHDIPEAKWAEASTSPRASWRKIYRFTDNLFDPACPVARAAAYERCKTQLLDHAWGVAWKPTATGRSDDQTTRFTFRVVEHDGPSDGPPTPIDHQIAAIQYARLVLGWKLLWILSTGGKGIHGIFDTSAIGPSRLEIDISILSSIGCDAMGLTHAHTRTPGIARRKCAKNPGGKLQSVLWIAP